MCLGVAKSGSPISRWMMSRPSASRARARTSTLKAPSTPSRSMREASFMDGSGRLAEERDAVAEIDEADLVADVRALAVDSASQAPAVLELDDSQLIGHIVDVGLGWRVNDRLGVNSAGTRAGHAAPRMVTTLVAPEPPKFCARPSLLRAIWRSPASPRIWSATPQI